MIVVSNNFKNELKQPKTIDAKILIGNEVLTSSDINSLKRVFKTSLFKTVMKQVDIDSNTLIEKGTTINPQFGLYIGNAFEYISLGNYKAINEPTLNKDTNSYQISTYDIIVDSMTPYALTTTDITYPCSVRDLFVAIFTKLGWATTGIPATFVNSTSSIEQDVFSNVNMTYRDVLDELCTISCNFLVEKSNVPTLIQKTTTSEIINEYNMKNTNVAIKNRVFFNSLVFSRAEESDNIYRKDDTSIANNGLHEFKISDLQILSLNWRDNFIDAMWNYIKTFEYYSFEVDTYGIAYLEPIDEFTLSTFNDTYTTLLLCSDLTIGNGFSEKIYADETYETQTEYKYASDTDRKINQTTLIVDKQQQEITALVSSVDTIEGDLATPSVVKSGTEINIDDASATPLLDYEMYGNCYQENTPTPASPQTIYVVKGKQTINFSGKNRLNLNNLYQVFTTNTSYDVIDTGIRAILNSTGTYACRGFRIGIIKDLIGKTIRMKCNFQSSATNDGRYYIGYSNTSGGNRTAVASTTTSETTLSMVVEQGTYNLDDYVIFMVYSNNSSNTSQANDYVDYTNMIITLDDEDMTYEQFVGFNKVIDLGNMELCGINDYKDFIYRKNAIWYKHKVINQILIDGNTSWGSQTQTSPYVYRTSITNYLREQKNICYNEHFNSIVNGGYSSLSDGECCFRYNVNDDNKYFYVCSSLYTSASALATFFTNNNSKLYYVLNEEEIIDEEITNSELINQLNTLMQTSILSGINHITIDTNNLKPTLKIEYARNTDINKNFVNRNDLNNYYTIVETNAQIQISNSQIQQSVSEIRDTLNEDGESISSLSNQVNTVQTSTDILLNFKSEIDKNGVDKVTTETNYTFNKDGLNIAKSGSNISSKIDNNAFEIKDGNTTILFAGYNTKTNKTEVKSVEMIADRITAGNHRCETFTDGGETKTGWFYIS